MGYSLVIGGEDVVPLASTRGWHDFKSWVDTLDEAKYPTLVHIVEWGWCQDLQQWLDELAQAINNDTPKDSSVVETALWLRHALEMRNDQAESAFVSDGIEEEEE